MMTYSDPHPNNKTCGDCTYFRKCLWLMSQRSYEARCDWIPSRFKEKRKEDTDDVNRTRSQA